MPLTEQEIRERGRESVRRYRAKNKAALNAKAKVASAARRAKETPEQREKRLAAMRNDYRKNRDRRIQQERDRMKAIYADPVRYQEHRRKENEAMRRKYAENEEYRKAKLIDTGRQYRTRKLKLDLLDEQESKCGNPSKGDWKGCGKYLSPKEAQIDHIIPKHRGGSDEPINLQVLHPKCNQHAGYRNGK